MKNISIIGTVGIPAKYGGFETLAENLVLNAPPNVRYTVFCSSKFYVEKENKYGNAILKYVNIYPNGISSILYDFVSMCRSVKSDVMLILGVSGCLFLPFIHLVYHGKIITNIDGIEWKRNKWNKFAKLILYLSERIAVRFSDIIIADNQGIVNYIYKKYSKNAVLIEYGADQAIKVEIPLFYEEFSFVRQIYAVSVCRIEPENNIDLILDAFSRQSKISIVIVGNWENGEYGKKLFDKYSHYSHLILLNPIYDIEKINFIRSHASVYIHGHSAGGTNPSLTEAMHLGLPIFAFNCIYNRCTTENQALYWSSSNDLNFMITKEIDMKSLEVIADKMKTIALKRYTWSAISKKYIDLY